MSGNERAADVAGACTKHWSERAVGRCEDCGELWCKTCLVPPARKRQPVRCVDCALVAGGVRTRNPRRGAPVDMNRTQKRPTNLW